MLAISFLIFPSSIKGNLPSNLIIFGQFCWQILEIREAVEEATNSETLNHILSEVCMETPICKAEVLQRECLISSNIDFELWLLWCCFSMSSFDWSSRCRRSYIIGPMPLVMLFKAKTLKKQKWQLGEWLTIVV